MDRVDQIRWLVLKALADDYENVDQTILHDVARDGGELGLTIERPDVVRALGELIEQGLAKAYRLSSREGAVELQGMPLLDVVEEYFETYFYITAKGIDTLRNVRWWFFDDEAPPRPKAKPVRIG